MKKTILIVIPLILLLAGGYWLANSLGSLSFYPPIPHKPTFHADTTKYPSQLAVDANQIVKSDGEIVTLRGVMLVDPALLAKERHLRNEYFAEIAAAGANVVRIPVHPEHWERDPDYLWRSLDPVIQLAGENGLYAIIDLHFIGNIDTSTGAQMPDIDMHARDFSLQFWKQVASYFKDAPHVIYEVFNEPAEISSSVWHSNAESLVNTIRETGATQMIVVGGVDYSRDLSWVLDNPVAGNHIAYAAHVYPGHSKLFWDHWFGNVAKQHPVLMTEWGWVETDETGRQPYLVGTQQSYGEPLIEYLDHHQIGWVACWYHDRWQPAMFTPGTRAMNSFGNFIIQQLGKN